MKSLVRVGLVLTLWLNPLMGLRTDPQLSMAQTTSSVAKTLKKFEFNEMQSVAKSQNVTFVVYSIMPNLGTDPEHQSDLGIYVLQPDGDLHFELVPLNQLSTVVASVSQSLARGGFRQPVTILVLTLSGGVALLLLLSAIVLFLYFKKPNYCYQCSTTQFPEQFTLSCIDLRSCSK